MYFMAGDFRSERPSAAGGTDLRERAFGGFAGERGDGVGHDGQGLAVLQQAAGRVRGRRFR